MQKAMDSSCPTCGAKQGERCKLDTGEQRRDPHRQRSMRYWPRRSVMSQSTPARHRHRATTTSTITIRPVRGLPAIMSSGCAGARLRLRGVNCSDCRQSKTRARAGSWGMHRRGVVLFSVLAARYLRASSQPIRSWPEREHGDFLSRVARKLAQYAGSL